MIFTGQAHKNNRFTYSIYSAGCQGTMERGRDGLFSQPDDQGLIPVGDSQLAGPVSSKNLSLCVI